MNRFMRSRVLGALAICAALAGLMLTPAPAALAQGLMRDAPKDVKRGLLAVSATPPIIQMDGKPDRLSPGARIRDTNNMLVLSGGIAGQTMPVVYRRDASGLVHEAWILTPEEDAKLSGSDSLDGYKRFAELLAIIFGLRR